MKTWRVVVSITTPGNWNAQDVINIIEPAFDGNPDRQDRLESVEGMSATVEDMEQTGGVIEVEQEEDESEIRDNDQPKPRRDA